MELLLAANPPNKGAFHDCSLLMHARGHADPQFGAEPRSRTFKQVSLFSRYFNQSPEQLGPEPIRTYEVYLTKEKKLATGSILMAISALRFPV
jgi:hypothetical protein